MSLMSMKIKIKLHVLLPKLQAKSAHIERSHRNSYIEPCLSWSSIIDLNYSQEYSSEATSLASEKKKIQETYQTNT